MRLRVLYLIDSAVDTGGAERFALGLAKSLPRERFELLVCSTRRFEASVVADLSQAGIRHLHLGRRSKIDVHRFAGLIRLLRRESFDVLHAHMFGSNVWGTIIGRACGVPVIIAHEQTWSYEGDPLRRWIDGHLIGSLATRFVAVSNRDAERMVCLEGVPPAKVVMIPNAYVPHPASPDIELRAQLGIGERTPLLAVVAMLRRQKALSVLLDAYPQIIAAVPDTHLVIAGDGECRGELERQAERLALTHRVHFVGRRDDVDAILRSADLAVLSSDFEGTPLVAYESLVNGTPMVATNVGGLPDIIEDGVNGRLVPPRDPDALASAIIELLRDPERRDRMAAAAAGKADELTIDAAGQRFAALYESLVASRARRNGSALRGSA